MAAGWRTVQFFVSAKGIHEVEIDTSNKVRVRCSCRAFKKFAPCVHANYVRKNINNSDEGPVYSVSVPDDVTDEEAYEAIRDTKKFREFILKHGKVLSID